jgi:uracil-DNA glycosylase
MLSGPVLQRTVPSGLAPPATTQDPRPDALTRREALESYAVETSSCTNCRLAQGRTQVVFGVGNPDADLMFVGEAPGFHEDKQGYPFVGSAGKLLDKLLEGIELSRRDVYICNVIKCRPPGNRDPQPDEIEACEAHLFRQIELIEPKLIATLGNFATKLLSGKQYGITRVHGRPQEATLGGRRVTLYPIYHPAAALYTPAMLKTLEEDFAGIPALLEGEPAQPASAAVIQFPVTSAASIPAAPAEEQLGLF